MNEWIMNDNSQIVDYNLYYNKRLQLPTHVS